MKLEQLEHYKNLLGMSEDEYRQSMLETLIECVKNCGSQKDLQYSKALYIKMIRDIGGHYDGQS